MMQRNTRFALVAAAVLAAPAGAHAQTGQPAPTTPPAAPVAPADEAGQLRQRIAALQQQALADPATKGVQDTMNAAIQAAMARLDPTATARTARAAVISQDVAAARAANDNARLNQLAAEATQLNAFFENLRPRAMQDPQVQAARQVYLARVFERMTQIDPNAQRYVDRLGELQRAPQAGGTTTP